MNRRLMILAYAIAMSPAAIAQTQPSVDSKQLFTQADNAKSMTRQSVLANFLQAAANNLSSTTKNAQLKASLFALDGTDSVTKYSSQYYLGHTWERHTQVILGGGLDASSNFNAISLGGSYDFLHKNDASEADLYDRKMKPLWDAIVNMEADALQDIHNEDSTDILNRITAQMALAVTAKTSANLAHNILHTLVTNQTRDSILKHDSTFLTEFQPVQDEVNSAIKNNTSVAGNSQDDQYLASYIAAQYMETPLTYQFLAYLYSIMQNGKAPSTPAAVNPELFSEYTQALNKQIALHPNLYPGKDLVEVYSYIETQYKLTLARIKLRPSLSLGYTYTYNENNVQNQHAPYLSFLWGFGNPNKPWELTIQAGDSVVTDTTHHTANHNKITASPGIVKVFASDKEGNSLLEISITSEFDQITSSLYKGEKKLDWLPTATLQARPTSKSAWISIVIKKDMNKGNFLGFLKVTFNLSNPKGSSN